MTKESFYKKLKKLIEKDKPDDCRIVYDYMTTSLYVINSDAEFIDNEIRCGGATIGSTTPQNGMGYGGDTGNAYHSIVSDGIYVDLEAVQQY